MPNPVIRPIIQSFHSRTPLRVGSLIVTIFGDAVLPHGRYVPLSKILNITAAIGIDDGAARVAMHRLEKDGWLKKQKVGRNVHYALSSTGELQSKTAAKFIYGFRHPQKPGQLQLLVLPDGSGRADARQKLLEQGCGAIAPNIVVSSGKIGDKFTQDIKGWGENSYLVPLEPNATDTIRICTRAWPLDVLNEDYGAFVRLYRPLQTLLLNSEIPGEGDALTLRTLLIHDYRRLILKDPFLPASCLPKDWPGRAAREILSAVYDNLCKRSKHWLDEENC